jgi:hypothetical protein
MTDQPTPPPTLEGIDPARIRRAFTTRELGTWELTVGVNLDQFTGTYVTAMISWWAAKQDGEDLSPDQVLDMSLEDLTPYIIRGVELLGKAPTGGEVPSTTSKTASSASLPNSRTSTTSPSPSSETSPEPS